MGSKNFKNMNHNTSNNACKNIFYIFYFYFKKVNFLHRYRGIGLLYYTVCVRGYLTFKSGMLYIRIYYMYAMYLIFPEAL